MEDNNYQMKIRTFTFLTIILLFSFTVCQVTNPDQCPPFSSYQEFYKMCLCWSGYRYANQQCIKEVICPEFSSYESWSNQCLCWNGYIMKDNKCIVPCEEGWQLDYPTQSKCVKKCPWNHYFNQLIIDCVPCPVYSIYEPSSQKCRCLVGFQPINGQCRQVCPDGEDRVGNNCVCKEGSFRISGHCGQCQLKSLYDPLQQLCVCQQGYIKHQDGKCSKICPILFSIYDQTLDKCICSPGYAQNYNGDCVQVLPAPNQ